MNPSSSSSVFFPKDPTPNPNPNFFHHHYNPYPLVYSSPSTSATTPHFPPPDLPATLLTLKNLIHLSTTTIQSISTLLPTTTPLNSSPISNCPFNPHHQIPPNSLFHHYLQCPSSPSPIDPILLQSLQYPKSLQSPDSLINQNNRFSQTLPLDSETDLCFSLDDCPTSLGSSFFYQDCPGVVSFPRKDSTNWFLTLPVFLAAECVNFTCNDNVNDFTGLVSRDCLLGILPSELWAVKNEIRAWNENGYPSCYSYGVLRLILCSYYMFKSCECHMLDWLMLNSVRYGIVIDVFMRDHIFLIFRLCLKAITREAMLSWGLSFDGEKKGCNDFKCPVVGRALLWLASRLSVLYGEVSGKLLALDMFKQCLLIALLKCLLFSNEVDKRLEGPSLESSEKKESTLGVIFVSQVAATAAALHERFLLETKIKAIRDWRPLPNYQRVAEHGYLSKKAEEERQKRSNYRPVLEHDGFLWPRANNEDKNKMKSREELLAEERDYKRRRMSYRGKKMKRSTTKVMRDIIEEYMEEIKKASRTCCLLKGSEDAGKRASEPITMNDISKDNEAKIVIANSSEGNKGRIQGHWEESASDSNIRSTRFEDESAEDIKRKRQDPPRHPMHKAHGTDRNRYDRDYDSSTAYGKRSNSRLPVDIVDQVQLNELRLSRKYYPSSPDRSHRGSHEQTSRWKDQVHKVKLEGSHRRNKYGSQSSAPIIHPEFEDRYDPSKSCDVHEDDLYSDSKYVGPD